ncbi:unnamed protein product [Cladocopium goreaui]|uniref:Pseudouridine synthase RsuA/RluA-like domain-containing protein n=1 Tax=Cladocopium goreaui TaxID=2562237 RepID=A0A9P1DA67_9DINO|nr:unnamed protein product [Cladocopium goreaui]
MPFLLRDTPHLCVLWKPPGWTVSVSHSSVAEAHAADVPGVQGGRAPRLQDWIKKTLGVDHSIALDPSAAYGLLHRLVPLPSLS